MVRRNLGFFFASWGKSVCHQEKKCELRRGVVTSFVVHACLLYIRELIVGGKGTKWITDCRC